MTKKLQAASALALMMLASPALASELTEGIQDTLNDVGKQIEEARIWKMRIRPSFSESVIWTDNVYLNAKGEQPFKLTSVSGPSGLITNPQALKQIERTNSTFKGLQSEGRVQDTIFKTNVSAALSLPVNPNMTKLMQLDEITVLSAGMNDYNYVNENDLDATDFYIKSDVFGFLDDLLSYSGGNKIWVRAKADYEKLTEPLDTDVVELQQIGILRTDFVEFERKETSGSLDVGYVEGKFDGFVGGTFFRRRLEDEALRQAEYDRFDLRVQAGWELPWFTKKHAYVRYDYSWIRPDNRSQVRINGVLQKEQALNNGDYYTAVVGFDGAMGSEKLNGRAEIGYGSWNPNESSGLAGDTSSFNQVVGMLELAYMPWEDARNTKFQFTYDHLAEVSAISNYNKTHRGTLTVSQALIPKLLDGDISLGLDQTTASEGPTSTLYDAGFGLVYHWFDQVDVSMRYLFRKNNSHREIKIASSFTQGNQTFSFTSESDGDFYSHSIQLGLDVNF